MFEYKVLSITKIIVCGAVCGMLAACGSPTYGTGKTQEELLFESLTSIPRIGRGVNEKKIKYISRPTLVTAPQADELPKPLEPQQQNAQDEFFSPNPEQENAQDNGQLPDYAKNRIVIQDDEETKSAVQRFFGKFRDDDEDFESLPLRIDPTNEDDVAAIQAPERRWLTEPPRKYRTPEAEAPIGDVGEPEIDIEKAKEDRAKAEERKKKGGLFGLFKKDKDEDEDAEDANAEDEDTSADDSTDDDASENSDS